MSACFDENVDFDEFADEDINLSNWSSFHDDHNDASENPPSVESKSRKSSVSSAISSIPAAVKQPSREAPKVERKKPQIRGMQSDKQELFDLTIDNSIMRDKLDRMHAISSENLLLQSDVADYHAELVELRNEAKELRAKCHELVEDNRINKQEVRDLRRYIDLQKANKNGDTQQDLLNKIEYYQMEHDRLLDEVRRLKNRLGDLSPRRSRETSPKSMRNTPREKSGAVSKSRSRSRSPVADAIAASTASAHAASRLNRDHRSLSPNAILNIRDLTMERYKNHMRAPSPPSSLNSDSTEILLKTKMSKDGGTELDLKSEATQSDDEGQGESAEVRPESKIIERHRSSSRCRTPASYRSGFRSLSPRMTSTKCEVQDTARDRYTTLLKRSLPRRAFAPRSPADLRLGYAIKFTRPGGKLSRGTVRYIGHLPTRTEIFIGVELDGADGKHTGTFQGTKYFSCPANKGIFTPFSKVIMAWE